MAQQTRAALASDQATNLASSSDITAAELRQEFTDLTDSALLREDIDTLAELETIVGVSFQEEPAEGPFVDGDKTKLDGIEASADVTDATNVAAAGAPIITSGAGAPVSTPAAVGDVYIDTTGDVAYVATDTVSSADWDAILISGGDLGTPSAGVATNLTGTAAGLTAGNVTTNANLTGHVTSTGNAAVLGSFTKAQLDTAVSDATLQTQPSEGAFVDGDKTKLDGIETAADVTDATNVGAAGAPIITSGAVAPTSTPGKVGDVYVDTVADKAYVATGTASSADWDEVLTDASGTTLTDAATAVGDSVPFFDVSDSSNPKQRTWTNIIADLSLAQTSGATATGVWDFGGATSLEIPNSATPTVDANGEIAIDTTVTDFSAGVLKYFSTEEMAVVAMPIAELTTPTNGHVVAYNATNDEFELVAQTGGGDMSASTYDPATIAEQLVGLTATQTLSGKTLTAPKLANGGFIADANGNELIIGTTTASAVNEITVANAATGNAATITSTGEANAALSLQASGTGNITLGSYTFDADQTVGAGQDNYVLTYDNGTGLVSLEAAAGGGNVSNTGTPADSQIGVWTSATVMEGDADFTFDTSSNTLALAPAAGTSIMSVGGANILVDSPRGTMTLSNVDALDATTEATIEAAIDTLANLTSAASLATVGTITSGTWTGTTIAVANGGTGTTTSTGTGSVVLSSSPTLVTPALGTPSSGNLGSCTAYPGDSSLTTVGTVTTGNVDAVVTAASTSTAGKIRLATVAETDTGTATDRALTPDALAGSDFGKEVVTVCLFDDSENVTVATGNDAGDQLFRVPSKINGWNLVEVAAYHQTAGTGTGTQDTLIMVHNVTDAADMMSTGASIREDELDTSDTNGSAGTINTATDDVATGDKIGFAVDTVTGTTPPKGLWVELTFQAP